MAISVPYNPVPRVAASDAPTPNVSVQGISTAAFGGDVAQGLESTGKTFDDVGTQWFARAQALQKLNNDSEAREADANYTVAAGDLSAKYNALEGKDAVAGRADYVASLQSLRSEAMAGLSNDQSRQNFADSSLGTMSRLTLYSATHAATENRNYVTGAATAQAAAAVDSIAQTPEDPAAVADAKAKSDQAIRIHASVGGWSPEQTAQAQTEQQSQIAKTQLLAIANRDPDKAADMFATARGTMTAPDIDAVQKTIDARQTAVGSRQIAQDVTADIANPANGRPEKSLKEIQDAAAQAADDKRPDDIEFKQTTVQRATMQYSQIKAQQRDDELRNNFTVTSALTGAGGATVPTNPDELRAVSPDVAKAYDNLDPQRQLAVNKALVLNAKGDVPETAATLRQYQIIRGQAISDDPATREAFLYSDVASLPLPMKNRVALANLQQSIKKSNTGDVRVNTAMSYLQNAGVAPRLNDASGANADDISHFRGSLQDALDEWQLDNKGKKPTNDVLKQIGGTLVGKQVQEQHWYGNSSAPLYQFDLPDEARTSMQNEAASEGRPAPTDEQMRQAYVRQRYMQVYNGGK